MPEKPPAAHRYKETAIRTANPLELIVILYDGAIHALQQAQEHLEQGEVARRTKSVNRAMAVISELQACLNFKEGGEIAVSLDRLYTYMRDRIFAANAARDPQPIAEVVALLQNLRSAWCEVANLAQKQLNSAERLPDLAKQGVLRTGTTGTAQLEGINVSG
jgi:flagellar protein FliS